MESLFQLDAVGLAEKIRRREVSAVEVTEAALARIERLNPIYGAVVGVEPEAALAQARTPGEGALAGVPWLVKDLLAMAGRPVEFGSRLFRGYVSPTGSPYAEALEKTGMIRLGRTSSSELGLLGSTETLAHGVTKNPWDLRRSATGSSGGAAVAVAVGLVPVAHASDGGGSIRIPASVTGTFGFKPSRGRCLPAMPPAPVDLVAEHVITRSVRDSAVILHATEATPGGVVRAYQGEKLKIACYTRTIGGELPATGVAQELARAAQLCRALGHEVVEVDGPTLDVKALSKAFFDLSGGLVAMMMGQVGMMRGLPVGPDDVEPFTWGLMGRLAQGPQIIADAAATIQAQAALYLAWLSEWDATLCPTTPDVAPQLGWLAPTLDEALLLQRTERLAGYTPIHNMAGVPAMSVPLGWVDGLPVGMCFAAPHNHDARLLSLAYQLEAAAPWRDRWPPVG